jgi:AraC family transcriptional regulator of adaptative response/methylated-DNA-[protein]-cysteine methyltransferase
MSFHAYGRARRLSLAMGQIRVGDRVVRAAFEHGYESLSGFNDAFRKLLGAAPRRSGSTTVITVNRIPTPLGPMIVGATDDAICLLELVDRRSLDKQLARIARHLDARVVPGSSALLDSMTSQLDTYFGGASKRFSVPIVLPGTAFQRAVWAALLEIPYGETRSYRELAVAMGTPKAVRAVANANGLNRIAIVVPCHRVIGADGTLTGYGGGLWRKRRLLALEQGTAAQSELQVARLSPIQ